MPQIKSYSFGKIVIDDKVYYSDVIIYPEEVRSGWWRKEGHKLHIEDLKEVIERNPECLIIGTGFSDMLKVPDQLIKKLEKRGINIIILPTKDACRIFNKLLSKGKKVIAALHLTC